MCERDEDEEKGGGLVRVHGVSRESISNGRFLFSRCVVFLEGVDGDGGCIWELFFWCVGLDEDGTELLVRKLFL